MGMENARLQSLAMAGTASPSTKAAALRGAQYANASAQTGISQAARDKQLQEFAAQQQALAALRGGDVATEGQGNAYSLGQRGMMADQALAYERMRQNEQQFGANLAALGEQTQAGAYGQTVNANAAQQMQQNTMNQQNANGMMTAAGNLGMYYMMQNQGGGNNQGSKGMVYAPDASVSGYTPGSSASGKYGNWSF
jgi:hypothetical protein